MARTMKAFVMKGIGKVGFMDKPVPEVGPNDALVKTTRALVCTSDVHTLKGAIGDRKDLTFGHEAVGIVARIGSEVSAFNEGDRVAVNAITPCYKCDSLPARLHLAVRADARRLEVRQPQGRLLRRVFPRQ